MFVDLLQINDAQLSVSTLQAEYTFYPKYRNTVGSMLWTQCGLLLMLFTMPRSGPTSVILRYYLHQRITDRWHATSQAFFEIPPSLWKNQIWLKWKLNKISTYIAPSPEKTKLVRIYTRSLIAASTGLFNRNERWNLGCVAKIFLLLNNIGRHLILQMTLLWYHLRLSRRRCVANMAWDGGVS